LPCQDEKWTTKKTHKGNKWNGPKQYEDKTGELMMLPGDLALVEDPGTRTYSKNPERNTV
jgi:catalase (peroxidase I)